MKCVISGPNVKILAKAIHALAKIGDEMYVEPQKDSLSFRTVNMVNSAYANFTFCENYFSYYTCGDLEEDDALKCKISMRSAMTVFKTPNTLDKQVETCHIKLEPDTSEIRFILKYKNSIVKTHLLPIIDCEKLQAMYIKDGVPNQLLARARLFTDAMHNFQQNLFEITMETTQQKLILRNYIDDTSGMSNITRTQLALSVGEFDRYTIDGNTAITFCMKELKAILLFADAVGIPVGIYFETAGRPVVFVLKNPSFEVNLVLSTLNPDVDNQSESTIVNLQEKSTKRRAIRKRDTSKKSTTVQKENTSKSISSCIKSKSINVPTRVSRNHEKSMKSILYNDTNESKIRDHESTQNNSPVPEYKSNGRNSGTNVPSMSGVSSKTSTTMTSADRKLINSVFSTITKRKSSMDTKETEENDNILKCEELNNAVPSSPARPTKKAKIIFKKCFQTTFDPGMLSDHDVILVEDSD